MTAFQLKSIATNAPKLSVINYRTKSLRPKIANGRHIAAGAIITSQTTANSLPSVNSVICIRKAKANRNYQSTINNYQK